ncbi:hypothetical protein [Amycolatopsis sp. NPDC021455]|uniref:hypothetical protein n=1 Tax=Amycolatopsis sp. NPDC021455 TaxID=3154901 RepID=UPI0033E52A2E
MASTKYEQHRTALLMHLAEPGQHDADAFLAERSLNAEHARELIEELQHDGLVRANFSLVGTSDCRLTSRGEERAEQLFRERPGRRVGLLRQRMLTWLDSHRDAADWMSFLSDDQIHHDDGDFTKDELQHEAAYLMDSGLVRAHTVDHWGEGMIGPRLTSNGRDCVLDHGGDVRSYFEARTFGTSSTTHVHGPTFNGSMAGAQVAFNNTAVTQNQRTAIERAADQYQNLARIVAIVVEQMPEQNITDQEREDVEIAASAVSSEITGPSAPQSGRLRRAVKFLSGTLVHLGDAADDEAAEGIQEWGLRRDRCALQVDDLTNQDRAVWRRPLDLLLLKKGS